MFFYPNDTYIKAIENGEKGVLRALLVGIIGSDPTFATSEYVEARKFIKEKSISAIGMEMNLEETYLLQEAEYEKPKEQWDEAYFGMLLVWLRDNFATAERLPKIKEVGAWVYKDKNTLGKAKIQNKSGISVEEEVKKGIGAGKGRKDYTPFTKAWWIRFGWIIVVAIVCVIALFKVFLGE